MTNINRCAMSVNIREVLVLELITACNSLAISVMFSMLSLVTVPVISKGKEMQ